MNNNTPNYIQNLTFKRFFGSIQNIIYDLYPDVNILTGDNGSGKTTILRNIRNILENNPNENVDIADINISLKNTNKLSVYFIDGDNSHTSLDLHFNKIFYKCEILKNNTKKDLFFNMVSHFLHLVKSDEHDEWIFYHHKRGNFVSPYQLSTGEKRLFIMLLNAFSQNNESCVMIIDEPETSLHTDWQELLIRYIRKLNPNAQLIIATQSPAIITDGWENNIFEIPNF